MGWRHTTASHHTVTAGKRKQAGKSPRPPDLGKLGDDYGKQRK
jgi:hypothetical protein